MQSIQQHITITDAITWRAAQIMGTATDPHTTAQAHQQCMELLANIPDDFIRQNYFDNLVSSYKLKNKKQLADALTKYLQAPGTNNQLPATTFNESTEIDDPERLPKWIKPYYKQWQEDGYMSVNTMVNDKKKVGFYTLNIKNNEDGSRTISTTEQSNFLAEPIMHVYNGPESLFIFRLVNHRSQPIIEVPASSIPAPELFQKACIGEGNFMLYCNAMQWKRIASALLEKFTKCIAIPFLGWQADGFFAFVNGILIPGEGWQPVNDNGIVIHKKEQFLIPASSQVYLKTQGRNSDAYESDRPLYYNQKNSANLPTISQWAAAMHKVYGQKAYLAIAALPMAIYRDVLFNVDNNCPLLYAFGEPSSGKSKYAESINAVFFKKRMAFNVNSGTDHAFFSYMQRFINTITWLNEVDEATLKPEWFQALKGAYDGESRERGRIVSGKLKTEIQKILSLIILTGQKLITADDNSLVTRSLIEAFSKPDQRKDEEIENYNQLKTWEENGLQHLVVDIVQHRKIWEDEYKENINIALANWRRTSAEARNANQRILQNWAHVYVNYAMLEEKYQLPVHGDVVMEYCLKKAIKWSKQLAGSDILSEWWATIQNLVNTGQLKENWDFQVKTETSIKTADETKDLQEPKQVLYLRLINVHPLYEKDSRSRGKNPISKENLLQYMISRKYFIGAVRSRKFYKIEPTAMEGNSNNGPSMQLKKIETVASCHAYIYEPLNIEITKSTENEELPFG